MIGAGIVGKILYVLTRCTSLGLAMFERIGGFVFFGGLIGAILGLYIYSKRKWDRFLDLLDTYASLVPFGQAIGRIGCYFNGCCYGKSYVGILSVKYIVDGKETYVFPTWFIESFFCFLLFICMFGISKKVFSGVYSAIYMMSYSLFRFIIEFFRGDLLRGVWGGLSTSQYISICVFAAGIIILIRSNIIREKNLLIIGVG
jgi:phosphatidylglycerol:prolipoprotein diacylglycerol transferase